MFGPLLCVIHLKRVMCTLTKYLRRFTRFPSSVLNPIEITEKERLCRDRLCFAPCWLNCFVAILLYFYIWIMCVFADYWTHASFQVWTKETDRWLMVTRACKMKWVWREQWTSWIRSFDHISRCVHCTSQLLFKFLVFSAYLLNYLVNRINCHFNDTILCLEEEEKKMKRNSKRNRNSTEMYICCPRNHWKNNLHGKHINTNEKKNQKNIGNVNTRMDGPHTIGLSSYMVNIFV